MPGNTPHDDAEPREEDVLREDEARHDDLEDTVAEDLAIAEEGPRLSPVKARADVNLDEVFDKTTQAAEGVSTWKYDPEAGRSDVAVKIRAAREAIESAVGTPFGKLIIALVVGLGAISLGIMAAIRQERNYIIAAAIVIPPAAWLIHARYNAWLGHKRYMYRLLETLGEDVSDFDPHRVNRKIGTAIDGKRKKR
ncbi:MAG: hypothetical protein JNM80_07605 [Phycisphaerae bacterium]|nr:hypothetical protein [Phycisphaerae bacterium]